ncbi:MAG: hypothetical protein MJA82_15030 [Clostridia bacterium]|nr:hypothetical protein [Clostridia bacterium]
MRARIKKKILKRACKKIKIGQELTAIEQKMYIRSCEKFVRILPKAINRLQKTINRTFRNIVNQIENNPDFRERLEQVISH